MAPWLVVGREIELGANARKPARTRHNGPQETAQFKDVLDANAVMRLAPSACRAELDRAGATYTRVPASEAPQVRQPIRVTRLGGVRFLIPWTNDQQSDPHAIWDCRLAVAILPLARWLARHDVTEVHYFSVLRLGAMARSKPRSQHNVGLALDLLGLVTGVTNADSGASGKDSTGRAGRDSDRLDVEDHFPRGEVAQCPWTSPSALSGPARLYANLVCVAVEHRLVHTLLTPDHDHAHENHLHLDVKAGMAHPVDPYVSFAKRKRPKRKRPKRKRH